MGRQTLKQWLVRGNQESAHIREPGNWSIFQSKEKAPKPNSRRRRRAAHLKSNPPSADLFTDRLLHSACPGLFPGTRITLLKHMCGGSLNVSLWLCPSGPHIGSNLVEGKEGQMLFNFSNMHKGPRQQESRIKDSLLAWSFSANAP